MYCADKKAACAIGFLAASIEKKKAKKEHEEFLELLEDLEDEA